MKRIILLLLVWSMQAAAQDVGYSQFYDQPMLRNPALAGIFDGDVRVTASYRNQWQSVTVPYRTFGLSAEYKTPFHVLFSENSTVTYGLQVLRDVAGTSEFSTTQVMPAINSSFYIGRDKVSYISIAFMGGLMQQRFDPSKLQFNDQFVAGSNGLFSILPSSRQTFDNTSVNYFDLGAGVSYNGTLGNETDLFAGAAIFHANSPQVGFFKGNRITLNKKVTFNAGLSVPTSETNRFILYADYFRQFRRIIPVDPVGISTMQFGAMYSWDLSTTMDQSTNFTIGMLYRKNDALIPVVRMELYNFLVGLSYDINVDKLAAASQRRGGLELVLSYRGFLTSRNENRRQTLCPTFRK
jgi:type IX secretion system PorP/SprF family membrane protein